jgi:putative transposase
VHKKKCKRYNEPGHAHEITFSCNNQQQFLKNERTCEWLAEAILAAKDKHDFHLWAYVFMPEHIHLLIWPVQQDYSISNILKSIKQPISQKTAAYLRKHDPDKLRSLMTGQESEPHRFWQAGGGYDRNITSVKTLIKIIDYIHRNPVRRGLVSNPEDWKWSSALEWSKPGCGPIPIDRESFPIISG